MTNANPSMINCQPVLFYDKLLSRTSPNRDFSFNLFHFMVAPEGTNLVIGSNGLGQGKKKL